MVCGVFLLLIGIFIFFYGEKLAWFGHLPGDIRIEKENVKVFIPITTMILLSVLLTLMIHFLKKLF